MIRKKKGEANEKDLEENGIDVPVSIIDAVYGDYTGDGGRGNNKWKQGCTDKGEILCKKRIVV